MRRSSLFGAITRIALIAAFLISVAGAITAWAAPRTELTAESFALLAAFTGIFAERHAAAQERRQHTLSALQQETRRDAELLKSAAFGPMTPANVRPRVYPRLLLSAVDAALTSGTLDGSEDSSLAQLLNRWRDIAQDFNHRLDLTELKMFLVEQKDEILDLDRALHEANGFLHQVQSILEELAARLRQ